MPESLHVCSNFIPGKNLSNSKTFYFKPDWLECRSLLQLWDVSLCTIDMYICTNHNPCYMYILTTCFTYTTFYIMHGGIFSLHFLMIWLIDQWKVGIKRKTVAASIESCFCRKLSNVWEKLYRAVIWKKNIPTSEFLFQLSILFLAMYFSMHRIYISLEWFQLSAIKPKPNQLYVLTS